MLVWIRISSSLPHMSLCSSKLKDKVWRHKNMYTFTHIHQSSFSTAFCNLWKLLRMESKRSIIFKPLKAAIQFLFPVKLAFIIPKNEIVYLPWISASHSFCSVFHYTPEHHHGGQTRNVEEVCFPLSNQRESRDLCYYWKEWGNWQ